MTMIELLLVMALLGLMLGAGVGMVSSLDLGRRASVGLVQNILRAARNSALTRFMSTLPTLTSGRARPRSPT